MTLTLQTFIWLEQLVCCCFASFHFLLFETCFFTMATQGYCKIHLKHYVLSMRSFLNLIIIIVIIFVIKFLE